METTFEANRSILQRFFILHQRGRLAHAYLFVGPQGIGKSETAMAIAKFIECDCPQENSGTYACGRCPACLKTVSRSHPDIHVIENDRQETIKIEQIRDILEQIRLKACMGKKKIFIIKNIEQMTADAANALLKTLEEPTAHSLLILTTTVQEKILDTVKSRCHMVHFPALSREGLQKALSQDSKQARFISHFAEGSLGKFKQMDERKFYELRDEVIAQFIFAPDIDNFIKGNLNDKQRADDCLMLLLSWIRDGMLVKAGVRDDRLIHSDRLSDIENFLRDRSFADLSRMYEEAMQLKKSLLDNLNIKIPFILLKETFRGKNNTSKNRGLPSR